MRQGAGVKSETCSGKQGTGKKRHNEIFRCGLAWVKQCYSKGSTYFTVINDENNTHRHYNKKHRAIRAAVSVGDGLRSCKLDRNLRRDVLYLQTGIKTMK